MPVETCNYNRFVPVLIALCILAAWAQQPAKEKPKFKAIWEPVNYKEDITLNDVFFVSKEEGWVTGAAGTILHTKDGGNNWTAELGGDPHAEGRDLIRAFFTNPTHGWAQSWNALYRTTDGESWQQMTGDIRGKAFFVSDTKGFLVYGSGLSATTDGGKTWKQVLTCRAKLEVQGLTKEEECKFETIYFPSATVGYATGHRRILWKTEDGGDTWRFLTAPEEPGNPEVYHIWFLDANIGFENGSGLFRTIDGGQSWQNVIATFSEGYPIVKFADREVGWSCLGNTWAYTFDGGKRWTTRSVHFPAAVTAFCLPTRDRGYVVGNHGMIYRYRVVPFEYVSKGMIDAVMVPAAALPGSGK
jgi:photosystem II stability/assembly factor-like uncharacterized protein